MKNLLILLLVLWTPEVWAQVSYLDEAKALGTIAGQGLACQASKYQTFELLARAIILTKSPSDMMQNQGLRAYMEEKANVFISKQMDGFADCPDIAARFDNQDIYKVTLYADGTIKMPDGKIYTPRVPYDANAIYDVKSQDWQNANAIYNRDLSNVKKVNFVDENLH